MSRFARKDRNGGVAHNSPVISECAQVVILNSSYSFSRRSDTNNLIKKIKGMLLSRE